MTDQTHLIGWKIAFWLSVLLVATVIALDVALLVFLVICAVTP